MRTLLLITSLVGVQSIRQHLPQLPCMIRRLNLFLHKRKTFVKHVECYDQIASLIRTKVTIAWKPIWRRQNNESDHIIKFREFFDFHRCISF